MSLFSYKDKRREPRYDTKLPAKVETKGEPIAVTLTNVSASGLKLACPRQLILELTPNIQLPDRRAELRIPVLFQPEAGAQAIRVSCAIVYVRRQAQDCYLLGCRITHYQGEGERLLNDYVAGLARAASRP
ncbi:PilZ domain-containing protein [Gallaecimonas sp. GXIMD4217]|uniref:PilZ domain-containing protein n=1 Tax=Gallaecimonas sp. GXIMD4217 TaxID=3131927 RepID=UPI00311AD735